MPGAQEATNLLTKGGEALLSALVSFVVSYYTSRHLARANSQVARHAALLSLLEDIQSKVLRYWRMGGAPDPLGKDIVEAFERLFFRVDEFFDNAGKAIDRSPIDQSVETLHMVSTGGDFESIERMAADQSKLSAIKRQVNTTRIGIGALSTKAAWRPLGSFRFRREPRRA